MGDEKSHNKKMLIIKNDIITMLFSFNNIKIVDKVYIYKVERFLIVKNKLLLKVCFFFNISSIFDIIK